MRTLRQHTEQPQHELKSRGGIAVLKGEDDLI